MAVPGRPVPEGAPADLAQTELFAVDAYLRDFEARVESVDAAGHRVRLARTAFYPGGGGQPHDLGHLTWSDARAAVSRVARDRDDVQPDQVRDGDPGHGLGDRELHVATQLDRLARSLRDGLRR